jgi:hypothetical protein
MDDKAARIIQIANEEKNKAINFLNLYQQFADLGYPVENQITTKKTYGEDKSLDIRDPTAIFALEKATSGFIGAWIPRERYFFGVKVKDHKINELDEVKRYCALAVQIAHDELFESNYITNLQNTVKSCIGFGTGNNYSEWDNKTLGLNFKDWHVSYYTFKQNSKDIVDTMILEYELSARQMVDQFDNVGDSVLKAAENLETESRKFSVIHIVRPRLKRTYSLTDKFNMPFESVFVNKSSKEILQEGGFEEFPFAVPRWEKASCEKWGRGRGLAMLSAIKELQQMRKDYMEASNRHNHPPYEVVSMNVEGEVNMKPDGRNDVTERGSINPLNPALNGNIPVTVEAIKDQRELIKQGFYNDIFSQFGSLTGDRRTTTEIDLRYKEGLRQLISPVSRFESECFTPQLSRVIRLLIRNGRIPAPPDILKGKEFTVEYMGELSMAMKDMQSKGFERGVNLIGMLSNTFPEVRDEINIGRTIPDVLINYGMKVEHLNTPDEKQAAQQQRQAQQQAMMAMEAAKTASEAYNKGTKAPEKDSASDKLMQSVGVK